jgi:hypothetical protein
VCKPRLLYDHPVVSDASFSRASGIAWEEYYRAIEGRPLRPLFLDAIEFLPSREAAIRLWLPSTSVVEPAPRRSRCYSAAGQ